MRIRVDSTNHIHLDEPQDFRRFSVAVEQDRQQFEAVRQALVSVAELEDESTAWVGEDALRHWQALAGEDWNQGLSAMIEKAKPYGWYDEARRRIKAHVEWIASDGATL